MKADKPVSRVAYRIVCVLCLMAGILAGWSVDPGDEWLLCLVWVLSMLGGIFVGLLWGLRAVATWRIRWIVLEHARATAIDEEPRDIDEVYP